MTGPTLYAPKAQLEAWLSAAAPGHTATYATGPALDPKNEVVLLVKDWIATGEVAPVQRRLNGALHYQVQRRLGGTREAAPRRLRLRDEVAGTAEGQLLQHLSRLANLGLPCPSNAELAKALGFRDGEAARYRFNNLVKSGDIAVTMIGDRRVVTVVATGKRTVAPVSCEVRA